MLPNKVDQQYKDDHRAHLVLIFHDTNPHLAKPTDRPQAPGCWLFTTIIAKLKGNVALFSCSKKERSILTFHEGILHEAKGCQSALAFGRFFGGKDTPSTPSGMRSGEPRSTWRAPRRVQQPSVRSDEKILLAFWHGKTLTQYAFNDCKTKTQVGRPSPSDQSRTGAHSTC